jgi:hypothetical protein
MKMYENMREREHQEKIHFEILAKSSQIKKYIFLKINPFSILYILWIVLVNK